MKDEYDFSTGVRGKYYERYKYMTNVKELFELVQRGANGVGDTAAVAAKEACQIILKEDYLGMTGWPEKAANPTKKVWVDKPGDKGYKMTAKRSGTCNICNSGIAAGDQIYFKSGSGANHVACIDQAAALQTANCT